MYTPAGLDLTTHSTSLLDGRLRLLNYIYHAARAGAIIIFKIEAAACK
jgi:hypothetical protein